MLRDKEEWKTLQATNMSSNHHELNLLYTINQENRHLQFFKLQDLNIIQTLKLTDKVTILIILIVLKCLCTLIIQNTLTTL